MSHPFNGWNGPEDLGAQQKRKPVLNFAIQAQNDAYVRAAEHWEAGADLFAEHSEAVQGAYAEMEANMLNSKAQEQAERALIARGWRRVAPGFWRAPVTHSQQQRWYKWRLVLLGYALGLASMLLIAWVAKL